MVVDAPDFDPTLRGHTSTIRSGTCHAVTSEYPDSEWPAVHVTECGIKLPNIDLHYDLGPRWQFVGKAPMCRDCWPEAVFSGDSDAE
jgi:hypothetical protein